MDSNYTCRGWKRKGQIRKLCFVVLLLLYLGFTTVALTLKATHLRGLVDLADGRTGVGSNHGRHRRDADNTTGNGTHSNGPADALNCTKRAIEEFPENFFSERQTRDGAIAVHILIAIYMFGALAIVCDDYFVSSLEVICDRLSLQEDVAGATFMAAGSSAPEFFTSVIGVFIAKSDVGVGTIVGSAVFNILFIIGMCALTAGMIVKLTWYPMTRDCLFYLISITALVVSINDEQVYWYEATVLVVLYVIYIVIMFFNRTLEKKAVAIVSSITKKYRSRPDELFARNSGEFEEKQPLSDQNVSGHYGGPAESEKIPVTNAGADTETTFTGESSEGKPESLDVDGHLDSPWTFPDSIPGRIYWIAMVPMKAMMYITIPDCRKPGIWSKLYPLTFVLSIVWIAGCSYLMVWMAAIIGDTLDIPDTVMGLTILAAGTSVPDCLSSIFVARDGYGDMAVSNSIGSNVFDILMCLGIPWLLDTTINTGEPLLISSKGIIYSVLILLFTVVFLLVAMHISKWKLSTAFGVLCLIAYVAVTTIACLFELNVFGDFLLPSCPRNSEA